MNITKLFCPTNESLLMCKVLISDNITLGHTPYDAKLSAIEILTEVVIGNEWYDFKITHLQEMKVELSQNIISKLNQTRYT